MCNSRGRILASLALSLALSLSTPLSLGILDNGSTRGGGVGAVKGTEALHALMGTVWTILTKVAVV